MRSIQTVGQGYNGSGSKLTSVAGAEVLTNLHDETGYYNFNLQVFSDCHISVNGSSYIFIGANTSFETSSRDAAITSLKIQESGVQFIWVGAY